MLSDFDPPRSGKAWLEEVEELTEFRWDYDIWKVLTKIEARNGTELERLPEYLLFQGTTAWGSRFTQRSRGTAL